MAEKEKKGKKGGGHGGEGNALGIIIVLLILAFFASFFYSNIRFYLENLWRLIAEKLHLALIGDIIQIAMYFYMVFFIFIIAYCVVRMIEIRQKEHEYLQHEIAEYAHHHAEKERKMQEGSRGMTNERWAKVLHYLFSSNPNDWKLAIIEADTMLDLLMDQLGFKGDNLGEKLKNADRETFRSLSSAWEVHITRNKIAHQGSEFELSQHEAKRIIALYEQIFREFAYI